MSELNSYTVTDKYVELPAGGRVSMTPEQLKHRLHNLKHAAEGVFEIRHPIQFKRGETFQWSEPLPKAWRGRLEQVGEAQDSSGGGGTPAPAGAGATPPAPGFSPGAKPRGRARARG